MKKLIFIFGGQASGKMTVGEELSKITGLKLFHNHMTVEIPNYFYGFPSDQKNQELKGKHQELFWEMNDGIREVIFSNVAKSFLDGMIFTGAMDFGNDNDWKSIMKYKDDFTKSAESVGEKVELYIAELNCDYEERVRRNTTPNRLAKKPSKRNLESSRKDVERSAKSRFVSTPEEQAKFNTKYYLQIDNTNLSAIKVAESIKQSFKLFTSFECQHTLT